MKELEVNKLTIGELLSKNFFFSVPSYQRPFSWEQANFEELIDDISTASPENSYFLGTIVLHRRDGKNNYDVVDGQQRLTSLLILLACLRDAVDDQDFKNDTQSKLVEPKNVVDGIPERIRVEVRDRSAFSDLVAKSGGTKGGESFQTKPDPLRRYLIAISAFAGRIEKMSQPEVQRVIRFISQRCLVMVLSTENFDEAFRLFSIVNDRGKQLRRIDVLKATNISPEFIVLDSERDKIASEWENLENEIGETTFESIFYLLRLSLLKDKPQGDLLKEFDERVFKAKRIQKGQIFIDFAFNYARVYKQIFIDRDIVPTNDRAFHRFRALIHIMDAEFQASEWRATIVSYALKFGSKSLYEFCLRIEKLFLDHWLNAVRKDERYSAYSAILNGIEQAKKPTDALAAVVYDEAKIRKAIVDSRAYGASYCKYVLLRLELATAEHVKVNEFDVRSIEHVLPQNPDAGSKWLKVHDAKKLDEYVHSFGNLVLLSKGKNSSSSNLEFDEKKKKYLAARVSDFPRSIQVLDYKEWTKAVIEQRTKDAADLVMQDP